MFRDRFDESSDVDILRYSAGLIGKSLSQVATIPESEVSARGKGRIGALVEKYYFGYEPNNDSLPDFPKANLELKVTGLKSKTHEPPVAKERLSLNLINFYELASETFEGSAFYRKCQKLLILCYRYDASVRTIDQEFTEHQFIYSLIERDLSVIKQDWELIQSKVLTGKAHEISEGDTFFLKANRKGAGGEKDWTGQPYSEEPAYRRGWSFNSHFLTEMIRNGMETKAAPAGDFAGHIELAVELCFKAHYGLPTEELIYKFGIDRPGTKKSKSRLYSLSVQLLQAGNISMGDLKKAGIRLKTVRLKATGATRESMSFPAFDYQTLLNQDWETSDFCNALEEKFLFVIFQEGEDGTERLAKAAYWNMTYGDRQIAREVWEETKERILDTTYSFPGSRANSVAHVRPHGKDSKDLILCPDGVLRMKRCFWLNKSYIREIVSGLI
jgi:DNA mismatch repair protein MutH